MNMRKKQRKIENKENDGKSGGKRGRRGKQREIENKIGIIKRKKMKKEIMI